MTDKSIAIIGTGAVGGFYGGVLARSGCEVHFLHGSDYEHVKSRGLQIDSTLGNFHLNPVRAYSNISQLPPCDLVVISLKTVANARMLPEIPGLLKKDGCVLILQNGLGVEEDLARFIPPEKILGGTCFICSTKVGPGHIHHQDYGLVKLGAFKPGSSSIAGDWARLFQKAGLQAAPMENLLLERWKKLVWNIPYTGLCVILKTSTKKIMEHDVLSQLVRELMVEVQNMAGVCGFEIEDSFIEKMLDDTRKMTDYKPSMLWDLEHGKPMEVGSIYTTPISFSVQKGFRPQKVETLRAQLAFINSSLQRGTSS